MIQRRSIGLVSFLSVLLIGSVVWAESTDEVGSLIRATLRTDRPIVQVGQPVWVEFSLTNLTEDPLTLQAPVVDPEKTVGTVDMGLPISHVFSGVGYSALSIENVHGETFDPQVSHRPPENVPVVKLAPFSSIGLQVELTKYYKSLNRADKYTLTWRPYRGAAESNPLTITVLTEKQAVIFTSFGSMTMRFYYNQAPNHVQNFIELIKSRFYDNLTFHRVIPGGLIQSGCPRGDGYGVRKDGKRLKAEFSKIAFKKGTVGMARFPSDPDSASCQFFICLSRQSSFDGNQTAFGYLVGDESFETLRKISAVLTGFKDRPKKPVYIRAISLENVPLQEREVPGRSTKGKPTTRPVTTGRRGTQFGAGR